MSTTTHRGLKRAVAGLTAGLLALSGLGLASAPASAQEDFLFDRVAGDNRFATAAAIALDTFGTADTVLLATGLDFPDALTGNTLAGAFGDTPILLTRPTALPAETRAALADLEAEQVIILGGFNAVSAAIEDDLDDDYEVDRIGGADRYRTAELVAKQAVSDTGTVGLFEGRRTAILGNGQAFPDVLAAGPLGYAEGFPITITFPTVLRAETRRVLEDLDIEKVIIVGGTAAVSPAVETEVESITGSNAIRVAGPDRFATAAAIANFAYDRLDFDVTHINLARGDDAKPSPTSPPQGFADALSGGPHGGDERSPIILTNPTTLPAPTRVLLEQRCPTLTDGHLFGGTAAVSAAVKAAAEQAASACASANRVTVTPADTGVEAGSPATGVITVAPGFDVASLTVSGCGVTGQPVTDQDAQTAGIQYSVQIPADQAAGSCVLTFTTTFTDGFVETDTVTLTVTARPAPSTIAVTPDDEITREVTPNPEATSTATDDRTFAVNGLVSGQVYRVTLVRCENVSGSGSTATFRAAADSASSTGFSADTGAPTADIVSVNGETRSDTDAGTAGFQSGTTTFIASGTSAAFVIDGDGVECVLPVVYFDVSTGDAGEGGSSARLEVQGPAGSFGAPVEDVDTGGRTNFVAPVVVGPANSATVQDPDPGQDVQQSDTFTVTITGSNIASARVDGSCVESGPITDSEPATPGVQGSARVLAGAAVGPCTLSFTTTFADGSTEVDTVSIDVVAEDSATVLAPVDGQDVQTSDTFTVDIRGANIASVRLDGDCVTPGQLSDTDAGTPGVQTSATATGAPGPCTLTFTTTFTDGESETDVVTIDVVAEDTATVVAPVEGQDVQRGDTFTATIDGSNIASVSVSGACVPMQTFPASDTSTVSFEVDTSDDAQIGPCELTFTTTFTDGESETDVVTIDVVAEDTATVVAPVEGQDVQRGDTFTATIDGSNIASVSVSGACVPMQTFPASDTSTVSFEVETSNDAQLGPCELTFTTTFTDGESESDTVSIDIVDEVAPVFVSASAGVGETRAVIMLSEPLDCASVDADGNDFVVTVQSGPGAESGPIVIDDGGFDAACDGDLVTLTLTSGFFQLGQTIEISRAAGTVVADPSGNEQPLDDRTTFVVGDPSNEANVAEPVADQDVQRTDAFTATVNGANLDSVSVDGPCVQPVTFTASEPGTTTLSGLVDTLDAAALGPCEITFTTTFEDGVTETEIVTIDIVTEDTATVESPTEGQIVLLEDSFPVRITGTNIAAVSIGGACVAGGPLADSDADPNVFASTAQVTSGTGPCELTFTTTFTDGETETDVVSIFVLTIAGLP